LGGDVRSKVCIHGKMTIVYSRLAIIMSNNSGKLSTKAVEGMGDMETTIFWQSLLPPFATIQSEEELLALNRFL
jgi:hypothetical protein